LKKFRIIFAGTSYFSAEHLKALISDSIAVIAVITKPDLPSGRGNKIHFSPVKILSIKHRIPILQPFNLNDQSVFDVIKSLNADMMIVVAYGKIIPKKILTIFPKGCINVHASLLPRWRGPTPIQSSIAYGDKTTGISIIKMDENIDTGSIINSKECDISSKDTTYSLSLKLIHIGIITLLDTLKKISNKTVFEKKQNFQHITISKKIYKKDALLDWTLPAVKLERLIRAFNPWPICYFILKDKMIKVWKATVIPKWQQKAVLGEILLVNKNGIQINTSDEILNVYKIQLPGKTIVSVKNIYKSKANIFKIGTIL
jgi:methionyl-tRNA formyltransferase